MSRRFGWALSVGKLPDISFTIWPMQVPTYYASEVQPPKNVQGLLVAMKSIFWLLSFNFWSISGAAIVNHLPRQSKLHVFSTRLFDIDHLLDPGGPDTVYSGNYRVYNCGDQAPKIINVLQTLWQVLLPALADANSREASDAYIAFFKDVYDAPTVAAVISNITTGAAVRGAHFPSRKPAASPIVMCANDPLKDPNKIGLLPSKSSLVRWLALSYNHCAATHVVGAQIMHTSITILCQGFFDAVLMPSPGQCMLQDPTTKFFTENGGTFGHTQVRRISWVPLSVVLRLFP